MDSPEMKYLPDEIVLPRIQLDDPYPSQNLTHHLQNKNMLAKHLQRTSKSSMQMND